MKFTTDPLSGQEMLCSGYSENLSRGEPMKWYSAEEGAVGPSDGAAGLPRVGRLGSSCAGEVSLTMGRSNDGYVVMCEGGGLRQARHQTGVGQVPPLDTALGQSPSA
jgi:hypothetical protein